MSDVKIDVHEVMQHLREVGGGAAFTLYADGTGALDLASGETLKWGIFPDFVLKFRGLKRQATEKRFIKAALDCTRAHDSRDHATCPQLLCDCDACREYHDALLCLRKERADHD